MEGEIKTFHTLIFELIERLFPAAHQKTARIILRTYYSQSSDRKKRITLESLGQLSELDKPVRRQRSDQILKSFHTKFSEEIKRLENVTDDESFAYKKDLDELRGKIESIVDEVETFSFPIFSERIQDRLVRLNLIDSKIYLPVVFDLAASLSIEMSFSVYEYKGNRILIDKDVNGKEYTDEIIKYAGKVATHHGGVFPVNDLVYSDWDSDSPESLLNIDEHIRKKYVLDVLKTVDDVMFLQNGNYYAFKERDERLSTILKPIYYTYKDKINKDILFDSVQRSLEQKFKGKNKSSKREKQINIMMSSALAFDEYCIRTLLLDELQDEFRIPGVKLKEAIKDYVPDKDGLIDAQIKIVGKIKEKGQPLSSSEFADLCRKDLRLDESYFSSFVSYPVLFYKAGLGRKKDLYKTLDEKYDVVSDSERSSKDNVSLVVKDEELKELEKQIHEIQFKNIKVPDDKLPKGQIRVEQGLIRKYLLKVTDTVETTANGSSGKCLICNRYYPSQLLIAAHIKKRSDCTDDEQKDVKNIAMLQCGGCDKVFEHGFIYIDNNGVIKVNEYAPMTEDLEGELNKISGNNCEYANKSKVRESYIEHHRARAYKKFNK